jgi:hypothetical protein
VPIALFRSARTCAKSRTAKGWSRRASHSRRRFVTSRRIDLTPLRKSREFRFEASWPSYCLQKRHGYQSRTVPRRTATKQQPAEGKTAQGAHGRSHGRRLDGRHQRHRHRAPKSGQAHGEPRRCRARAVRREPTVAQIDSQQLRSSQTGVEPEPAADAPSQLLEGPRRASRRAGLNEARAQIDSRAVPLTSDRSLAPFSTSSLARSSERLDQRSSSPRGPSSASGSEPVPRARRGSS